jgi:hypothetical protein
MHRHVSSTKDAVAQVYVQTQLTARFNIKQGLKQSDGLTPSLFNLFHQEAISQY